MVTIVLRQFLLKISDELDIHSDEAPIWLIEWEMCCRRTMEAGAR
jgi:hypothetical protein